MSPIEQLRFYAPFDYANLELPIIGEAVEILKRGNGELTYKRISSSTLNTGNFVEGVNEVMNPNKEPASDGGAGEYSTTSQTGTPNGAGGTSDSVENEYFEGTQVNHLNYYEGDTLKINVEKFNTDILIMADLCNCSYTSHGHCGTIENNDVDNDKTVRSFLTSGENPGKWKSFKEFG